MFNLIDLNAPIEDYSDAGLDINEETCIPTAEDDINNVEFNLDSDNNVGQGSDHLSNDDTEKLWNPSCLDEFKPRVGQMFATIEEGFIFYKEYGRRCGFDVRRSTTKRHKDGSIYLKYVVCSSAGTFENVENSKIDKGTSTNMPDALRIDDEIQEISHEGGKRRRTSSIRCECLAKVCLRSVGSKGFMISIFQESHNHELATESGKQFLRSNRSLTLHHMNFIVDAAKSNIGAKKAFNLYKTFIGSYADVGATRNDFKNFSRDYKLHIGKRDSDTILQMFHDKHETSNKHFLYEYQTNSKGHLTRIFWAAPAGRRSYEVFGDVVSFDATYRTNRYNMVFVPFIGLNNHWKTVTFAAALLAQEDTDNFAWVFEVFLKVMGRPPKCIITDQCPAMKAVIPSIFPESSHRFCMWHIMQKFPSKLGTLFCAESPFMKKIKKFVWADHASPAEFEQGWEAVLKEFGLENHKWLSEMYDLRMFWIPAYFRDDPMTGLLRTTSRSESSNFFFSHFVQRGDSLTEFFMCYENAIERQIHISTELNHTNFRMPRLATTKKIEKDAAALYTHAIFFKVQEEIKAACFDMELESVTSEEDFKNFLIKDPLIKDKIFQVRVCLKTTNVDCNCKLFTRMGYLCRHAFFCLGICGIHQIPRQQLSNRWLKNAQERFATLQLGDDAGHSKKDEQIRCKRTETWFNFQACLNEAGEDEDLIDLLSTVVKDTKQALVEKKQKGSSFSKKDVIEKMIGVKQSEHITVLPPLQSNNKGSRKRIPSSAELSADGRKRTKRNCKCCNKKGVYHDSRTCPEKNSNQVERAR